MNNKLKSFTLGEVLIVLVLTVVIVGMAFSVLELVTNQLTAIKQVYKQHNAVLHLKQQLRYDLDNAQELFYQPEKEKLFVFRNLDTIEYAFAQEGLFRQEINMPFQASNLVGYNLGKEVEAGEMDAVQFIVETKTKKISIFASIDGSAKRNFKY